jgi:ABC-type multidrug transport system fused ATPase/permease subunit
METEKIFKALFENFPSGNNGYKKADPKSERFYKRKETERKNNRADSDKNQIFFDFIAVFSAVAGAAFVAMAFVFVASAMIIVAMVVMMFVMFMTAAMVIMTVVMVMFMVFMFTAAVVAVFVFVFMFVTFAGHF